MIAIIDYGAGNLRSVVNAVAKLGYKPVITGKPREVLKADAVIFPGVGAAGDTMSGLAKTDMIKAIRQVVADDRPLFAICVGMQVLFSAMEEGGTQEGLGIIPGTVKRLPSKELKIPHMGWNQVKQQVDHPIFAGIPDEANFYFVHSYYADLGDSSVLAGTTEYGIPFCSMVIKGNLVATQFHPEKSGEVGLRMYSNFLRRALGEKDQTPC